MLFMDCGHLLALAPVVGMIIFVPPFTHFGYHDTRTQIRLLIKYLVMFIQAEVVISCSFQ